LLLLFLVLKRSFWPDHGGAGINSPFWEGNSRTAKAQVFFGLTDARVPCVGSEQQEIEEAKSFIVLLSCCYGKNKADPPYPGPFDDRHIATKKK